MSRKINPSWERERDREAHSPEGIEQLKNDLSEALFRKYAGLAETMFEWKFEDEVFSDMMEMSWGTVPELFLFRNGKCCAFKDDETGQVHILPYTTQSSGLNIYGQPITWNPVPVGWSTEPGADAGRRDGDTFARYAAMSLSLEDSVILKNDFLGSSDSAVISSLVRELVDNVLTMNQLQLLARSPFVFDVSEDNVLSAKNYFLAIATGRPCIFTNKLGEDITPKIINTEVRIDPALFEIFDRFECILLEQLGYPCVPITKRAQQSVSEVESNDDKISCRRKEKLRQRMLAAERMNKLWGTSVSVISVLDSELDNDEEEKGSFREDDEQEADE